MFDLTNRGKNFVGYEYKEILVNQKMQSIFADGYENFGWTLEGVAPSVQNHFSVLMKFKRDRKFHNKMEVTRLQRQFESCVSEVVRLERSKVIEASVAAYSTGVLGCAFLAGSVFCFNAGMLVLSIILSIPGFIGWIVPYFLFSRIQVKKSVEVQPLIEEKYDEIYEVCEKANALLAG